MGVNNYDYGTSVTASVASQVTENGVTYDCVGWSGTGAVASSGSSNSVTFTMTTTSSITWNWAVHTETSHIDILLNAGWNMVSFSVLPADTSFASIFSGIDYYQVVTWKVRVM